jgi:uncharacterized protein (DUF885 family)
MPPKAVLIASAALLLAGCAAAPIAPPAMQAASPAHSAPQADTAQRLHALFARSDDETLDRNPLQALMRGDMRNADSFGDYLSDAYFDENRRAQQAELAELLAIDRSALSPTDRIAYDVFRRGKEQALKGLEPRIIALTVTRPINHFFGFHTAYPQIASGRAAAPFRTVEDYENNLKRLDGFARQLDMAVIRFREGMASGVTQPKLVVENMVRQLGTLTAGGAEASPLFLPVQNFPDTVPEGERLRLAKAYREKIGETVNPAYARLRDFLRDEYLPVARSSVGLSDMPGGAMLYEMAIESSTTVPLTADYVHDLGLSEVARIRAEMDAIRREVGFQGDLAAFFEHIRTDPQFKPESAEALTEGYYEIGRKVDQRIGALFRTLPKTPLEIRPYPDYIAPTAAGASYQQGAQDGSRPGVFFFNTHDLPSRITTIMETLYLHEAAPGHHFQISLAQENEALPNFMRFGGNTAFVEGWALYAEKLGPELGLFTDPYQRFGHLDDEMLRAMRLVVDTGLHAKGWGRDQAIEYMLSNSAMGRTDATAEVERYIAIPGQALAYKIGQLKILELRARARERLGARFDIREFHEQVLGTGALPLTVLEGKIDDWIAVRARG